MKKVKITILKTTFDKELADEYGAVGLTACPMMKEGQVFYADYARPEGFCDEAWKAVYQYVFALAHGAVLFKGDEGLFSLAGDDGEIVARGVYREIIFQEQVISL